MARPEARRPLLSFRRSADAAGAENPQPRRFVRLPTFWKAMIITSFVFNMIFVFVIVLLAGFYISWRSQIGETTVGLKGFARGNIIELRDVVQQLQAAHIRTTIPLDKQLPLKGLGVSVHVSQEPTVRLVEPVPLSLSGAEIDLGNGNHLRADNINLVLPKDTPLTIKLDMDIPLDDVTIPIKLPVDVDIAMADTELAPQFKRLGNVVDRLVYPVAPLLDIPDVEKPAPPQIPK
jgi:hypothetical protein